MLEIFLIVLGFIFVYKFLFMKLTMFRVAFFGGFGAWMFYMIQSGVSV